MLGCEGLRVNKTCSKQPHHVKGRKMGGDHDQVVIEFSFASDWLREWHSGSVTMGRKEISDYFQHPVEKCSSSLSTLIS